MWNIFLNESVLCTIIHTVKRCFLILYLTSYDRSQLHAKALKNSTWNYLQIGGIKYVWNINGVKEPKSKTLLAPSISEEGYTIFAVIRQCFVLWMCVHRGPRLTTQKENLCPPQPPRSYMVLKGEKEKKGEEEEEERWRTMTKRKRRRWRCWLKGKAVR